MKLLVVYATTDGMTGQIAERLGEAARATGSNVDVLNAAALPERFDPSQYDGILVGASMHAQGYQRAATRFVRRYGGVLRARPNGFFSVCLSIVSTNPKERAKSRSLAEQFPAKLGWKPDVVEIIAGALAFSRYGFFRHMAMKVIAKKEMGPVDATRDTVFTDWDAVDRFARNFVTRVANRTAKAPFAASAG
jgi:menaquinone-dependent protoporphyrinogen oxidase